MQADHANGKHTHCNQCTTPPRSVNKNEIPPYAISAISHTSYLARELPVLKGSATNRQALNYGRAPGVQSPFNHVALDFAQHNEIHPL